MRAGDVGRLVALAAIWGASFLFTRIAAPAIGPIATADLRMLIGAGVLAAYVYAIGLDPQWRRWTGQYVIQGTLNSVLPFLLFGYAALELQAGMLAVLNATSPMWGAVLSAIVLRERLRPRTVAGLLLGIAGVILISRPQGGAGMLPVLAVLCATFLYGVGAVLMKRSPVAAQVPARAMALGTQCIGALMLLPVVALAPPHATMPGPAVVGSVIALGVLCSGIAYVLYFRLVVDIGATGALAVTYLIPVFGVLWGTLFLGEALTLDMLGGGALILLGTFFVLRK